MLSELGEACLFGNRSDLTATPDELDICQKNVFNFLTGETSHARRSGPYSRLHPQHRSRFGPSRPNPSALRALPIRQKAVFPAGIAAANLLGFTTENPARIELATDGLSLPRLLVGKETVIHTRRPAAWRSLSETDAALLDFLRNRGEASELEPEETVQKLLNYLREPGRFKRLLEVAPSEPPRVRAMLGAIGQQIGQQIGQPRKVLAGLRSTLNPLSRFDFGILIALAHAREWQAKERRPHETV